MPPKPAKRRALDVGGLPKSKDDAECDVELLELDMKGGYGTLPLSLCHLDFGRD